MPNASRNRRARRRGTAPKKGKVESERRRATRNAIVASSLAMGMEALLTAIAHAYDRGEIRGIAVPLAYSQMSKLLDELTGGNPYKLGRRSTLARKD